jgi:hypothetical protein
MISPPEFWDEQAGIKKICAKTIKETAKTQNALFIIIPLSSSFVLIAFSGLRVIFDYILIVEGGVRRHITLEVGISTGRK